MGGAHIYHKSNERAENITMDELLPRINELAKKAKEVGLTVEEQAEQDSLRAEYIRQYRNNLRGILDNTYVQYPDGRKEKLKKK